MIFDTIFLIKTRTLAPWKVFFMKSLSYLVLGVYKILLSSFNYLPKQDHPRKASVEMFSHETTANFPMLLPCLAIAYPNPNTSSLR